MAKTKNQGLKWFHFLIYFALWLNAIVCALNGIMQLTGASYEILGIAAEDMYATYPTLKTVDLVFGVAYLVFALFCIITRSRLAHFKKGAPSMLIAFYVLSALITIGSTVAGGVAMGLETQDLLNLFIEADFLGSIIGTVIAILINKVYFGKRAHMFVN